MSTPITHIIMADKALPVLFHSMDRKEFIVGTSLPDIRYIKVVTRESTHFKGLNLKDIEKEDSFIAGFKFHSLLDEKREAFMRKNGFYEKYGDNHDAATALKLLEDLHLYAKVKDWKKIVSYFSKLLPAEKKLNLAEESLKTWHKILSTYFKAKPTEKTMRKLFTDIEMPQDKIERIMDALAKMKKDKYCMSLIDEYHKNLFDILS